jgi:hypothetical protein
VEWPSFHWGICQKNISPNSARRHPQRHPQPNLPHCGRLRLSLSRRSSPPPAAPTPVQPPPAPTTSLTAAELRDQLEKMRVHENNTPEGNSWRQYCDERGTVVLLDGKLLDISKLTKITGFVVTAKTRVQNGETWHNATLIELAVKRADAKNVSAAMEMRPALWRSTGEQAWLLNYHPEGDLSGLVRVFGLESTSLEDRRTFLVGREPSFEEWRKLRNK